MIFETVALPLCITFNDFLLKIRTMLWMSTLLTRISATMKLFNVLFFATDYLWFILFLFSLSRSIVYHLFVLFLIRFSKHVDPIYCCFQFVPRTSTHLIQSQRLNSIMFFHYSSIVVPVEAQKLYANTFLSLDVI